MKHLINKISNCSITFTKQKIQELKKFHFFTPQINKKIQFLEDLKSQGKIESYFEQKKINKLCKQDIYYYLQNRKFFQNPPFPIKKQIIQNEDINLFSKFLVARQLKMLNNPQSQQHLIDQFNQSCFQLQPYQLIYCLQKLIKFDSCGDRINFLSLKSKIEELQIGNVYIQAIYYLKQLNQAVPVNVQKLIQSINGKISCKHLFFINQLSLKKNMFQLHLIKDHLSNIAYKIIANCPKQENAYAVKLLDYYPQHRNLIKLNKLNVEQYIEYLKVAPQSIFYHHIPRNVIQTASILQFDEICQRRVQTQLDTIYSLVKNMKQYYSPQNLRIIVGLFKYLDRNQIRDDKVWMEIQRSIQEQFQFVQDQQLNILNKYYIENILRIIGYLAYQRHGSINFWNNTYKFVERVIKSPKIISAYHHVAQKAIITFCYQIFTHRMPNQKICQALKHLTLLSLTVTGWRIHQLLGITNCLTRCRIGDHQLWLAIQNKILEHLCFNQGNKLIQLYSIKNILRDFARMGRGSYKLWTQTKIYLSEQMRDQLPFYSRQLIKQRLKNHFKQQ